MEVNNQNTQEKIVFSNTISLHVKIKQPIPNQEMKEKEGEHARRILINILYTNKDNLCPQCMKYKFCMTIINDVYQE